MSHHKQWTIVVPAFLAAAAALAAATLAQQPETASRGAEGVILLENGHILQGEITLDGDRYEVAVPGGRISLKANDVQLCCGSLEEVYQQRRARMPLANARDYLELAQWCQRQGLIGHAAEELSRAEALEPGNPLIPVLRRGLELAKEPPPAATPSVEARSRDVSTADLDHMVREMPPGTVESFAQTVQPLLVNTCAAAACHGPGSTTGFSLLRSAPGRSPSRRLTQRNLSAVLDEIDHNNAAASRLLTVPTHAHGSAASPVFGIQNASQYQQLVAWVNQVVRPDQPPDAVQSPLQGQTAASESQTVPAVYLQSAAAESGKPAEAQTSWAQELQGLNLGDAWAAGAADGNPLAGSSAIQPRPKLQRGAELPRFVPKDPFDPAIFNRRFHEGGSSAEQRP